ncbi:MAG: ABC transporter permease [Chitinophagaceae bacterium]
MINILCLAIGITFSMLIGVYVLNQKTVNGQLKNVDNQYVLKSKWKIKGMGLDVTTIAPLGPELKEKYPNLVANYFRFNPVTNVVTVGEKNLKENIAICDTNLVSMYGFEVLKGNKEKAFANNNSALITQTLAMKLFGTTEALDKIITVSNTTGDQQVFAVSAVLKDMPYNSVNNYIDPKGYNVFVPLEGNRFFPGGNGEDNWNNAYMVGMLELKPGVHPKDLTAAVNSTLNLHLSDDLKGKLQVEMAPLRDYYLNNNNGAVKKMITTLSLVAVFILLMAIINFININIGTSTYRLKEIGLRKVFGGEKKQLIFQHLCESVVLTFISGFISLILYELVRPVFDQFLNTRLTSLWQFGLREIGLLFSLIVVVGIIAGIYPAFILSSSRIIHSVKGKIDTAKGGLVFRKSLLVIQFTLAIVIFISALNVSKQVSYVFNKDLGYNKEQLLVLTAFPKQWDSAGVLRMEAIRGELSQTPGVKDATLSFEVPDRVPPNQMDLIPEGSPDNQAFVIPNLVADEHFASTYGIKEKEGTFFQDYDPNSAQGKIVLNETAVKNFGWTSAVGKHVRIRNTNIDLIVDGVVKDFNYSSFQDKIGPLAFTHVGDSPGYRYITIKLSAANISKTIGDLQDKWKKLSPNAPFEYTFMDQNFSSLYQSEVQLKKATNVATILNLVIVFMGIFGVVAFTLARRTKEIAVRKVLGADVKNIILLFIKDYAVLILLANIIAWPLAYLATDHWLENYAYRVQQNILPYIYVGVFIFASAFVFIALQCFKAAVANPVKNLRSE